MSNSLDNLEIYKLAEELEIKVYEVTKLFSPDKKYQSIGRLRKTSFSASNNIAEGYSRLSFDDKINKFYIARGEVEETKKGIKRAAQKKFISKQLANEIIDGYTSLIKGINRYIKFLYYRKETKDGLGIQMPKRPSNHFLNPQVLKCPGTSFTLIELMVSIGIIIVVIIAAVSIYLFTIGPQQKITATANLQQDGQLIMNMIAKDIRQNQINYSDYPTCVTNCSSIERNYLTLVDSLTSPSIKIKYLRCKIGGNACDSSPDCSLKKCRGSACNDFEDCVNLNNFKDVTMKDVTVTNFKVILNPGCNPLQTGTCSDCDPPTCFKNPQATIILELKSYKERVGERRIRLQETIPIRYQEKSYY